MNKKDLLDILYAERNRLSNLYIRPGWTSWAIIVAIVSLAWSLVEPIAQHNFSLSISLAICYILFNALLIFGGAHFIFHPTKNQPLWQKGKPSTRYGQIYAFVIYLSQLVALFAYKTSLKPVWLFYIAVIINIITLLLLLVNFVLSYQVLLRTQKINRYEIAIEALLRLSFVVLWGILLLQQDTYDTESIKVGLVFFAIVLLVGCLNDSTTEKLKELDKLIDKTLFEDVTNEQYVLSELEKCVVGLKYSDFLLKKHYDRIIQKTKSLYDGLFSLNKMVNDNYEYNESIRALVNLSIKYIQHTKPTLVSVIRMIKLGYDETNIDYSLSPLIQLLNKSLELMSIWLDVESKLSEYEYDAFHEYVNLKCKEANILLGNYYTPTINHYF
mgnify:CR=1 FL=1